MIPYRIYSVGSNAITIDFGNVIDEKINEHVVNLFNQLQKKSHQGILDIIPAYSSITVVYDIAGLKKDPSHSSFEIIKNWTEFQLQSVDVNISSPSRLVKIPVCYEHQVAPDLEEVCKQAKLSPDEFINIHSAKTYRVYMIGFLPGFAYMGKVGERIATNRKKQPTQVTAGSVGIAGMQTGIYSLNSPGGWMIVGKTPMQLFNPKKHDPVVLKAGDQVQFMPIDLTEFHSLQSTA